MKRLFLGVLVVTVFFSFLFSDEYDIRKLKWGMTYSQVSAAEGLTNEFFKLEDVLGVKVEVVFNIGSKGLFSVTYSTRNIEFHTKAQNVLVKKYGEPEEDLDYSFLMQARLILLEFPDAVLEYMKKPSLAILNKIPSTDGKLVFRLGLAKREIWQFGNSVALLVSGNDGVVLSYHSKNHYEESKKKFAELLETIKTKAKKYEQKQAEDVEKL